MAETATVNVLLNFIEPIGRHEKGVVVLDWFINQKGLHSAAVVDEHNIPVGLVDRGRLIEIFIRPYARDLYHKVPIDEFMDPDPVIVDAHTAIDDLARIVIDAGMRHMVSGFIIVRNGVYAGMGTGHDLLQEITSRKQRHLYFLAHYDPLTGLPNRLLFADRLAKSCQNAERNNNLVGLIYIDLDRFKYINDTMGHAIGDLLLKSVGERLSSCVRQSDTVARLGGDEFVILLPNIRDTGDIAKISGVIIETLRQPMTIGGREIQVTASLGIALYPQHDTTPDGLMRKADLAMYEAKQHGRNQYIVYAEEYSQDLMERIWLESQLKNALENREFSIAYQPQIYLPTNQIMGVEALLRWNHPELGTVSPTKFIHIAEETGLIIAIGEWMLRQACQQHCAWIQSGLPPMRIAMNVSSLQLHSKDFFDGVKAMIEETGIDPQYIELEFTEGTVMTDAKLTVDTLVKLRKLGIKLAIDDFGTGYSSLSYLRQFPLDRIKIDQSFIRNIKIVPANEAIVRAIIALGNNLGLEILAEGVENQEELECVKSLDCHQVQGYHFSRPIPAENFEVWYQKQRSG